MATMNSFYMKRGSRANTGDVVVKVEVVVQGDTNYFDEISHVNSGIGYMERPELITILESSRGTDADGFCLAGVESKVVAKKPVTKCRNTGLEVDDDGVEVEELKAGIRWWVYHQRIVADWRHNCQ